MPVEPGGVKNLSTLRRCRRCRRRATAVERSGQEVELEALGRHRAGVGQGRDEHAVQDQEVVGLEVVVLGGVHGAVEEHPAVGQRGLEAELIRVGRLAVDDLESRTRMLKKTL